MLPGFLSEERLAAILAEVMSALLSRWQTIFNHEKLNPIGEGYGVGGSLMVEEEHSFFFWKNGCSLWKINFLHKRRPANVGHTSAGGGSRGTSS